MMGRVKNGWLGGGGRRARGGWGRRVNDPHSGVNF